METFSALLAICAGNSTVPGEFSPERPVTQSFDVCFDLPLNKWLSKQSWCWWFKTPSRPLWRHSNEWHHQIPEQKGHLHKIPVLDASPQDTWWKVGFIALAHVGNKWNNADINQNPIILYTFALTYTTPEKIQIVNINCQPPIHKRKQDKNKQTNTIIVFATNKCDHHDTQ